MILWLLIHEEIEPRTTEASRQVREITNFQCIIKLRQLTPNISISSFSQCYPPCQPQFKDLPSNIGCEPIRSYKKLFSQNLPPLGKGNFAVVGRYMVSSAVTWTKRFTSHGWQVNVYFEVYPMLVLAWNEHRINFKIKIHMPSMWVDGSHGELWVDGSKV